MTLNRRIPSILTSIAAFLLSALALWVPSGYSYAAVLVLLGSIWYAPCWIKSDFDLKTTVLAAIFIAMGIMWFFLSLDTGLARWDKGGKWILGAFCLLFISVYGPRYQSFVVGLPIGCFGMGATALWQTLIENKGRANGYTNAIQWGNTGMLLACLAGACLIIFWYRHRWWYRILMFLAVLAALCASLLSESRGGWLVLFFIVPLGLFLARTVSPEKSKLTLMMLFVLVAGFVAIVSTNSGFRDRVSLVLEEVQGYYQDGKGDTSIGVRLQQYQLAADLISSRPLRGWGAHGFVKEVKKGVEAGEYSSRMVRFPQIHNDFLDVWVKAGLFGIFIQVLLYGWVLYMFWPSRSRLACFRKYSRQWVDVLALRTMGGLIPVCFMVFGMTQPFFNHNSGIMTYVFYVATLWGALLRVEKDADDNQNAVRLQVRSA